MPDFEKLYFNLFNNVSKAIELLQAIQQESEELYLDNEDPNEGREET